MPKTDYSAILIPKEFHVAHTWKRDIAYDQLFSLCGELRGGIENYIGEKGTGKINISKLPSALNRLRELLAACPLTKGANDGEV
jgi:hypothetical protein